MTRAEGVWLWLAGTQGIGARMARQLVEFFDGEEALWEATEQELVVAIGEKHAKALVASRSGEAINEQVRACIRKGVTIITPATEGYPKPLLDLYDPPCVLYCIGDKRLLNTDCLTVIGTRRHTRYGKYVTETLTREVAAAGLTIVSSLSEGLDSIAHRAALDAGGKTIAILACAIDQCYPVGNEELLEEIKRKGLVISELPPGAAAHKGSFPARNRLFAALSRGVLIPEAGEKSGTLLTCALAMDLSREVFVVPGNIDSPASYATNRLMRTSAEIVLESRDILERLDVAPKVAEGKAAEKNAVQLSDEESEIVELLDVEPLSFDEIIQRTQFPAPKLNSLLTRLQLKRIIEQSAGRTYARKR